MADYIKIVANNSIKDLSGASIPNGEFAVVCTDADDNEIPARVGNNIAQALRQPVIWSITSGSLPAGSGAPQVPNPASSDPSPIYFRITIKDLAKNHVTVYRKVQIVDSGDGTWNFASMQTGRTIPSGVVTTYVVGPPGPPGADGALTGTLTTPLTAPLGATISPSLDLQAEGSSTTTLIASPDSPYPLAHTDDIGQVALGTDQDGSIIGIKVLPDTATVDGDDLTLAGEMRTKTFRELPDDNPLGAILAHTDDIGQVDFGMTADGSIIGESGPGAASTMAKGSDGSLYFSATDAQSGKLHIFRREEDGTLFQLTTVGNNTSLVITADESQILFYTDRNGDLEPYQMSVTGMNQVPIGDDVAKADILTQAVHGQSTAAGFEGTPALSMTQPYNNQMLVTADTPASQDSGPLIGDNTGGWTGLTPLIESGDAGNGSNETPCSGLANQLTNLGLLLDGKAYTSVAMDAGRGGVALSGLNSTKLAAAVAAAVSYLPGKKVVVPALSWLHGEADEQGNNAGYGDALITFRNTCEGLLKAATGQTTDIPFVVRQLSQWYSNTTSVIAPQQIALARQHPDKFVLSGPSYQFPANQPPHYSNHAYRAIGEMQAKVTRFVMLGKRWRPLSFRSVQRIGSTIYVRFWVPVAPLVIDTTAVSAPTVAGGMYGFEYRGQSGTTITAVAIVSSDTVRITLSTADTTAIGSAYLDYARTAGATDATLGTKARGNIRDSDATPSLYGYPSFNWMIHDTIAC